MKKISWVKPTFFSILTIASTAKLGSQCEAVGDFTAGTNPCS
jgi:hypothetical protein